MHVHDSVQCRRCIYIVSVEPFNKILHFFSSEPLLFNRRNNGFYALKYKYQIHYTHKLIKQQFISVQQCHHDSNAMPCMCLAHRKDHNVFIMIHGHGSQIIGFIPDAGVADETRKTTNSKTNNSINCRQFEIQI